MTSYINEHAHHILKSTTKKQRTVLSVFKGALGSPTFNEIALSIEISINSKVN